MANYKVVVQIYKEFKFDAPSQADAMRMAEDEMKKLGVTDRYNVNHAKNLDAKKDKPRKFHSKSEQKRVETLEQGTETQV